MRKRLKNRILNFLLKHLFNAVTEDDVMTVVNGRLYIGKILQSQENLSAYASQARTMKELLLWEQMIKEMKFAANRSMYENSKTNEDIIFGKAALWIIDVMETKVNKLSKM